VRVEPQQATSGRGEINFFEIFSPKYKARTILASIICATQSMEYFVVGFNLPSISTRLFGSEFLYAILGAVFFNLFGIADVRDRNSSGLLIFRHSFAIQSGR
jgi:hypothetical protein